MAATRAMNEIRNITQLSISTAMDLFRIKILPVLTYGLESVGEYLTYKSFNTSKHFSRHLRNGWIEKEVLRNSKRRWQLQLER
ncbi:hypothetical protein ANN_10296 [Periplaneta americana]|uniref:Uncharacterized protein n=1 Tax=Periplaneta americana TaxID=6978 RepID=A0ABQ8TQI0_PERAM|nr:hypothetical protein ANN_10296 [Periplaneta americana]